MMVCYNENPFGMSERARLAAAKAVMQGSRYDFPGIVRLQGAVGRYMGGTAENVLLTHGSSEGIRAAVEAFAGQRVQFVIPELTYGTGEDSASRNGMKITRVPMLDNWQIDIDGMKKAVEEWYGPSIVYFVNPNNPTSTIADCEKLEAWIREERPSTTFLVDEAYSEFVTDPSWRSMSRLVAEGVRNLVILKTFSKFFAMAGMRLGFNYAHPDTVRLMRDRVAYDAMMKTCINSGTVAAALAELDDPEFQQASRDTIFESRRILSEGLDRLGIRHLPSQTNFIFADLGQPIAPFVKHMADEHIYVGRPFPPAHTWVRISLGSPDDMRWFVKRLEAFREKGWV